MYDYFYIKVKKEDGTFEQTDVTATEHDECDTGVHVRASDVPETLD